MNLPKPMASVKTGPPRLGRDLLSRRSSGVLLHVTSLAGERGKASDWGIGDFGPTAERFIDFLAAAGQSVWQILPLAPTHAASGNSPYASSSAFALDPLLISPERWLETGLVQGPAGSNGSRSSNGAGSTRVPTIESKSKVDYDSVRTRKATLFEEAFARFAEDPDAISAYGTFRQRNSAWLDDYALFVALKESLEEASWNLWPRALRDRQPDAIRSAHNELEGLIERTTFLQFQAEQQWQSLRRYGQRRGIRILGDLPLYVTYESADVWAHRDRFELDAGGRPTAVGGVPPDYFSDTGQLWGSPLYRWKDERAAGYSWWQRRLQRNLELYDAVRIDHFRGFAQYWSIPATATEATAGQWLDGPGAEFFESLPDIVVRRSLIAEDLGVITPDVVELIERLGLAGMRVLQFGFGADYPNGTHSPASISENTIVYTGTHDNNTVRGWFTDDLGAEEKQTLEAHLGGSPTAASIAPELLEIAWRSKAKLAIAPLQDLLGLGSEARMNRPSTARGNWVWRASPEALTPELAASLRARTTAAGRLTPEP